MSWQGTIAGKPLRWFYCFGTLQEFVAEGTFGLDYDIDIGIVSNDIDAEKLKQSFVGYGFACSKVLLNDVTKKPINMHFVSADKEIPSIDVYFWVKKDNIWYHTYDVNMENKKIPSKYVFKGIKFDTATKQGFYADEKYVENLYQKNPLGRSQMNTVGIWTLDIFQRDSIYKFYAPFSYGHCLDSWYDNWKFRKFNRGQSRSEFIKTVKSCKDL
jgi:predicted nucleotidyltransferase